MSAMPRRMPMLQRDSRSEAGFTLIEVMAAMVVFAALASVVFSILVNSLQTTQENSQRVIAANLAQSHIDSLRLLGTSAI
ncbi:MAG: type II secretion system protein, partial [Actinomycetota bacterium]|nr:type II secretion system protein [Actinomycetota bacterium]